MKIHNTGTDQRQKQMLLILLEENLMTAYSLISTPSNITSTYSGSVAQLLDQVVAQPQDFCLTTSWALPSQTQSDGVYLTGVSLTRREPNCPTSILTQLHPRDLQSLRRYVKNAENSAQYRSLRSEQKERNQLYSQLAAVIEARITQMESTLMQPSICHHLSLKNEDSCGQ